MGKEMQGPLGPQRWGEGGKEGPGVPQTHRMEF